MTFTNNDAERGCIVVGTAREEAFETASSFVLGELPIQRLC